VTEANVREGWQEENPVPLLAPHKHGDERLSNLFCPPSIVFVNGTQLGVREFQRMNILAPAGCNPPILLCGCYEQSLSSPTFLYHVT